MNGAHLLVVDDERELTALVRANLEQARFRVRTANDGREALAALAHARPDLVLLDIVMPEIDGWQVLAAMQRDARLADVPVVLLTGLSDERDVIRGYLSGAVHYLTKPFDLSALLTTIREALRPVSDEQRAERRTRLRGFVRRLAELDAGRSSSGPHVTLSRLEALPRTPDPDVGRERLERLSPRQLEVAQLLAAGVEARAIADRLGTTRSNVYATRTRIARHFGVDPDQVAEVGRAFGLPGPARR